MAEHVGQRLGNYRLIRLLGRGGFAEVYLGEHIYLQTQVAIKLMQMRLEEQDMEGFLNEARTVAGLKHPHIIRVLDFGIDTSTPFLVMDYAPNGTLRQHHPKGTTLTLPTITSYVKQVADALQYAHEKKLIHRDIKPENILLGENHQVLLSDFGIALITQSTLYQNTQEVVGTAAYMAPEQLQGKPRRTSDQYSLGIVVYEWLCGDRPFHGTFTELYSQHLFVPPPPLHEKVTTIPPAVEQVVLKALEKDPHKRFVSVQAFATALEQACETEPTSPVALPSEIIHPKQPSLQSDVVAAILPSQTSLPTDMATPPSQSPLPTNIVTPPSKMSQPTVVATSSLSLAASPPSTRESVPSSEPQPSTRRISRRAVVVGLAGLAVVAVGSAVTWLELSQKTLTSSFLGSILYSYRGHSKPVNAVAWSPNGQRIASASDDNTVQVWDATTGNNTITFSSHSNQVLTVMWSPNGMQIASGSADNTVQVWDATTGDHIMTYHGHSAQVSTVAWSPDGQYIASGSFDGTVQVWNAANGHTILIYRGHSVEVSAIGGSSIAEVTALAWSPDGKRIASASNDQTVQVWDAATGDEVLPSHRYHLSGFISIAWSPDGKRIASASEDRTVQVWDAGSGNNVFIYNGHSNVVTALAWSLDSKRIASGSWDRTVQVWDAVDGSHVYTYRGHSDKVNAAAWSPNGKYIASGGNDLTVQVWQAV